MFAMFKILGHCARPLGHGTMDDGASGAGEAIDVEVEELMSDSDDAGDDLSLPGGSAGADAAGAAAPTVAMQQFPLRMLVSMFYATHPETQAHSAAARAAAEEIRRLNASTSEAFGLGGEGAHAHAVGEQQPADAVMDEGEADGAGAQSHMMSEYANDSVRGPGLPSHKPLFSGRPS